MLTRAQKQSQVEELREKFSRATCVYVADYRGIDVEAANALRRRVRREGDGAFEYRVTKNAVLRRAAEGSDVAGVTDHFRGPTAVAISFGDPVGLARILEDFAKDHDVFEIKAGVVDGTPVGRAEIAMLATLPSIDELRGKIVGLLLAPATKIARLLGEPAAQIARVVAARSRQEPAG